MHLHATNSGRKALPQGRGPRLFDHVSILCTELAPSFQELGPELLSKSTRAVEIKAWSSSSSGHRPIRRGTAKFLTCHWLVLYTWKPVQDIILESDLGTMGYMNMTR